MIDWIACDKENPPPQNTKMIVWMPERKSMNGINYPEEPLWVDEDCYDVGEPGKDYTHYALVNPPERIKRYDN